MSQRPVAFQHENVEYKAFPEDGNFYGVWSGDDCSLTLGQRVLLSVPMSQDGSPDMDGDAPNVVEVAWMGGHGDAELLEKINAEFGTQFKLEDFAGR